MTTGSCKPLSVLRGLSPAERHALQKVGVRTTTDLLEKADSLKTERALAKQAGVSAGAVHEAANRADLMLVPGIGPVRSDLFENAGVNSTKELANRNAEHLRATLERFAVEHPELGNRLPSPTTLGSMIEHAKALQGTAPAGDSDATGTGTPVDVQTMPGAPAAQSPWLSLALGAAATTVQELLAHPDKLKPLATKVSVALAITGAAVLGKKVLDDFRRWRAEHRNDGAGLEPSKAAAQDSGRDPLGVF